MSTQSTLPVGIFNAEKQDYTVDKPIFTEQGGLFDTINKRYPQLWRIYKTLKKADWDENDFVYLSCNQEFKTCSSAIYNRMVKTLAWQWETDTVVARVIPLVLNLINPSSEISALYGRIADNEVIHSLTYSEIVRTSFDDPETVMKEILEVKESLTRLKTVADSFEEARVAVLNYALDPSTYSQDVYDKAFMFFVTLFCLERIQFMASFAITFSTVETTGYFQPIGAAIQKIAQDEYELHVQAGMGLLQIMMKTPEGKTAYNNCRPKIIALLNEVVHTEVVWNDFTFSEDGELPGVTQSMVDDWVYFNATDAAKFLDVHTDVNYPILEENPLTFMEEWLNISKVQRSPQEEEKGDYKVGAVQDDALDTVYEYDF